MPSNNRVVTRRFDFLGGIIPSSADSGPWLKTITGSGPPTVAVSGREVLLTLTNDSEVQNACLSLGNNLAFDIDDLKQVRIWARASTALGATAKARIGLAAARNDDPDAIAASILFGLNAASANLLAECDDGTNEVAATATGLTLGTTLRKLVIDFSGGIHAQAPPSTSAGGKAQVQLFAENANGILQRVLASTRFNMSAYSSGLQLFAQIQKTSSTDVGAIAIEAFEVDYLTKAAS